MQSLLNFPYLKFFIINLFISVFSLLSFNSLSQSITTQEIDSLHEVASTLFIGNNKDSVLNVTNYTLQKSNEVDYILGKARAFMLTGRYYLFKAQLDTAEILLNSANNIYIANKIFGDSIGSKYGTLLRLLGNLNIQRRNYEKAVDYFILSQGLFIKEGNEQESKKIFNAIGIIYAMQGDYPKALEYLLQAYDGSNTKRASNLIVNISICYKNMGHFEKAIGFLKDGIRLDVKNNWASRVSKYINLGTIYTELDQVDSAIYYNTKALESAKKFNIFDKMITAMSNLATNYVTKGEFKIANSLVQEASEMADSLGLFHLKMKFDTVKADLFYNKNKNDSTLFYAKRALKSASRYSNKRFAAHLTKKIANTFEKLGKLDSTFHYIKLHHVYKDSLFNKKNHRKFTELYAKMDNLEKQNKIELLTKEKKVETLKKQRLLIASGAISITAILLITLLNYRHKNRFKRQELKRIKLKAEVEKGQQNLYKQTLYMIHVNNTLDSLEGKVKEAISNENSDNSYNDILHTIKINKSLEKDWENFNRYFHNSHSDFYERLSSHETKLSNHEKRVCALIKLNLSNREIATILNIESKSVAMLKYRLKKKIGLNEEVDIGSYIQQL